MGNRQARAVVEHLCQLIDTQRVKGLSDAQLLQRFVTARDETAFAALMQRHGRTVLGVCQHVLRHAQDAEDAFQATFLVLARKAGSIRNHHSVGSWLYGVAYRIAMRAKKNAAKRLEREQQAATPAETAPPGEAAWRELQRLLDDELSRLPDRYRAPFLLCCLEGKTKAEAARELGWKEGTVSSRLATARKLLQTRLARRGVSLSAVLGGTALSGSGSAGAAVPALLMIGTGQAAVAFAAGGLVAAGLVSPRAVALAEGVLRVSRWKIAGALLLLATLAGGAAGMALSLPRPDDPPEQRQRVSRPGAKPRPRPAPRKAAAVPDPEREGGALTGQVLDPAGRPLAGADVTLVATFSPVQAGVRESAARERRQVLGSVRADAQGRFRLNLPRKALAKYGGISLLTAGGGVGPAWKPITRGGAQELKLQTEAGQELHGRLVDARGTTAAGVAVQVVGFTKRNKDKQAPQVNSIHFAAPPDSLSSWPAPTKTDGEGNFVLRGLAPDCEVYLRVDDPRFGPQWLITSTGPTASADSRTFTLTPARTLEGTITDQDTGQPLAGAYLFISTLWQRSGQLKSQVDAQTDGRGRFRVNVFPGDRLSVFTYPADGAPYAVVWSVFPWPKGEPRRALNVALPRGVLVEGTVTDGSAARPVAGAAVDYQARFTNPALRRKVAGEQVAFWKHGARTGPDGAFRVVVLAGPGHLLVKGPTADYLHAEVSAGELTTGRPGGKVLYPDGLAAVDYPAGSGPRKVAVRLRRGVTVPGKVVLADGRPARSAVVLCPHHIPEGHDFRGDLLRLKDGRFEIPGCDPDRGTEVFVLDSGSRQGGVATLPAPARGKPGGPEPEVRLAAIGSARARIVDQHGRPWDRPPVELHLVLRPGVPGKNGPARLTVSAALFGSVPVPKMPPGTVDFYTLIPGATYQIMDRQTQAPLKTFTIAPGQDSHLPDVTIARPEKRKTPGQ